MIRRSCLLLLLSGLLLSAASSDWVLIRTTDGTAVEGQANVAAALHQASGSVLSFHGGVAASALEKDRIAAGIAAIQGKERASRDAAVEELTAIGVPVLDPLLKAYKDTDQHEPRPLYRLFERIMPSGADGFDRTLSLVRMEGGKMVRIAAPQGSLEVRKADGTKTAVPWDSVRTLAVRKKLVKRSMAVHSLRHCNQIEYLDTGVSLSGSSKVDLAAEGFARLSFNEDGWSSDPNGLTKPGSPTYKTHLVGGHPFGALVGRVGAGGEVFFVGKKAVKTGLPAGRLMLAVNDNAHWQNNLGTYSVTLVATDAYDFGEAQ
ncbi:MAG: hypothetical protein SGI92_03165 [Bryobacteraceae bacterium]|nr:hypothetical protein [Bryobacteraceae bacterium]